jgi:putative copper resistance protein D
MRSIVRTAASGLAAGGILAMTGGPAIAHGSDGAPPTLLGALTTWSPDPLPWLAALVAAAAYVLAVRQVNRANPRVPVPVWRIAAWLSGVAVVVVALSSAIDLYADDLLSVHMIQHLLLAMIAPPLLALGAPVTVLLRVASPATRRRLILPLLHARLVRLIASPIVAWILFTVAMGATHFSPIYEAALENPTIHLVEHLVYLATGVLFWWPVVAADPVPFRLGFGARIAYLGLQMPVNAAVGLAIYFAPTVLYAHYATIERAWGPDAFTDQQIGGVLMWGAGDVILLAAIPLVVAAWMRADARQSHRADARRANAHLPSRLEVAGEPAIDGQRTGAG